jgi:hypothetical protein
MCDEHFRKLRVDNNIIMVYPSWKPMRRKSHDEKYRTVI